MMFSPQRVRKLSSIRGVEPKDLLSSISHGPAEKWSMQTSKQKPHHRQHHEEGLAASESKVDMGRSRGKSADFQFLALRISDQIDNDEMVALLTAGAARVGRGMTANFLRDRYVEGVPLETHCRASSHGDEATAAASAVVATDGKLRQRASSSIPEASWAPSQLAQHAERAAIGCIVLAGTAENFSAWALNARRSHVVSEVPDGRLFALLDGYIIAISPSANTAAWTVENGVGSLVWTDGSYYTGEMLCDMKHGIGTYHYSNGDCYHGEFKDDKREGNGVSHFADGSVCKGTYSNDKANGVCTFTFASGNGYHGEFRDDVKHGTGTFTFASGARYQGQWRDDVRSGRGSYHWPDGDTYVGEYQDDKMHGQGVYTYSNNEQQKVGLFCEGMFMGD